MATKSDVFWLAVMTLNLNTPPRVDPNWEMFRVIGVFLAFFMIAGSYWSHEWNWKRVGRRPR